MANNQSTKLQINFKLERDGDLINVYADNQQELEQNLTIIQDLTPLILKTSEMLRGSKSLVAPLPQPPQPTASVSALPTASAPSAPSGVAPTCSHGVMNLRDWIDKKTGQPKKGYLCASPKGTPNQCRAIMVS